MVTGQPVPQATLAWGAGLGILAVLPGAATDELHIAAVGLAVAGIVAAVIPGIVGRVAGILAVAMVGAALALEPSAATLALTLVVGFSVAAGRAAAARFAKTRMIVRAGSDGLARQSLLLDDRVAVELARARRHNRPLSVVRVGPQVSRTRHARLEPAVATANRLTELLRLTDAVGVTDDFEVIVLLPDTPGDVMPALSQRLRAAIDGSQEAKVGWASFPDDALTWNTLAAAAEARTDPLGTPRSLRPSPVQLVVEHEIAD